MRTAATILILTTVTLASAAGQQTQERPETALAGQLRRAEAIRREALLRNDIRLLDTLIAAEFTGIHALYPGQVLSKTEELASLGRDRRVLAWDPRDEHIRVYGNVGLVTAVAEVSDSLRGNKRRFVMQYTHIWVLRDAHWQLVHRHTTRVSTLEGPRPPATEPRPNEAVGPVGRSNGERPRNGWRRRER